MGEQLRIRRITAYCLLAVCAVVVAMIAADFDSPVRTIAVLLFVGAVPGWALISYVNVRHLSVTWISAVGLSLSLNILVAQVLVLTKTWHPEAAVAGLVCASVPLLAHHVIRSRPPETLVPGRDVAGRSEPPVAAATGTTAAEPEPAAPEPPAPGQTVSEQEVSEQTVSEQEVPGPTPAETTVAEATVVEMSPVDKPAAGSR